MLPPSLLIRFFFLLHLPSINSIPNPTPNLTTSEIYALLPPGLRPTPPLNTTEDTRTPTPTALSTCTRSYWRGTWTFSITIRNKITPEASSLGTGLYDNVNADCDGIIWPAKAVPLVQVGGRVTSYYVLIEVNHGESYGGCVEKAIQQAEAKEVVCEVVPSPCQPEASQCSV